MNKITIILLLITILESVLLFKQKTISSDSFKEYTEQIIPILETQSLHFQCKTPSYINWLDYSDNSNYITKKDSLLILSDQLYLDVHQSNYQTINPIFEKIRCNIYSDIDILAVPFDTLDIKSLTFNESLTHSILKNKIASILYQSLNHFYEYSTYRRGLTVDRIKVHDLNKKEEIPLGSDYTTQLMFASNHYSYYEHNYNIYVNNKKIPINNGKTTFRLPIDEIDNDSLLITFEKPFDCVETIDRVSFKRPILK